MNFAAWAGVVAEVAAGGKAEGRAEVMAAVGAKTALEILNILTNLQINETERR